MFDNIEEIYIENNTEGKKYKNIIVPIIIIISTLMIGLFIMKKILILYIVSFVTILLMIIFKCYIYLITVKPKKFCELIFIRNKYKTIVYNRTKKSIENMLKKRNCYNDNIMNILINYYKDKKNVDKLDISKMFNFIFSILSALSVLLTIENMESINLLYKFILYFAMIIGICWLENKILDKISSGILDTKVNNQLIYKLLSEIYIELISNNKKGKIKDMKGINEHINYISRIPTSDEFNNLTQVVGWGRRENKIVEEALKNTIYSLCVYDEDKLIGYGRIIGDKTLFLYIHDVMVVPEYQGKNIGTNIMRNLLNQIEEYKKINPNIRTYLGASKGKEGFYKKFGFIERPNEELGAGMILYNE